INDRGEIVGVGIHDGRWHAVLLQPTPEQAAPVDAAAPPGVAAPTRPEFAGHAVRVPQGHAGRVAAFALPLAVAGEEGIRPGILPRAVDGERRGPRTAPVPRTTKGSPTETSPPPAQNPDDVFIRFQEALDRKHRLRDILSNVFRQDADAADALFDN